MVGVLMLPETIHRRLDSIPNLSRQGKRINGLFRLLDGPELWQRAYEEIARNQGALTPGSTPDTLDGFSLGRVENLRHPLICIFVSEINDLAKTPTH
jgi:hypothetical protein